MKEERDEGERQIQPKTEEKRLKVKEDGLSR